MAINIPEITIYNLLNGLLRHIESDFKSNSDEKNSLLYSLFKGSVVGKADLYDEAVDLFIRSNDHPRKIETMIGLSSHHTEVPRIFITLASESPGANELGVGEYGHENHVTFGSGIQDGQYTPHYMRRFDSKYMVVCMSESQNECLLMYNLLKAGFTSIFDAIELGGLGNVKLSGQDLRINNDLIPKNIQMRGIVVSGFHEIEVPRFFSSDHIEKILFEGGKPNPTT